MFVMSRDAMDDAALSRQIWLPTERSFDARGTSCSRARVPSDTELDHFLGIPDASEGGVTAVANDRYGDITARASSAIDGDPATAWNTPLGKGDGSIRITVPERRSRSTTSTSGSSTTAGTRFRPELEVESDDGPRRSGSTSPRCRTRGTPTERCRFRSRSIRFRGATFTFTITGFDPRIIKTPDHPEGIALPTAIAELGIPGVQRAPMPAAAPRSLHRRPA